MFRVPAPSVACLIIQFTATAAGTVMGADVNFSDGTRDAGLDGINASRVCFADLDGDGRPDVICRERGGKDEPDRYRVFLNRLTVKHPGPAGGIPVPTGEFVEHPAPNLPTPRSGDLAVFADLDNDGVPDAIITRYLEAALEADDELPGGLMGRTAWLKGRGDGTFGLPNEISSAPPKTTAAIAVGDWDGDGLLDLYLGNWYEEYGETYRGHANDLLIQRPETEQPDFHRMQINSDVERLGADADSHEHDIDAYLQAVEKGEIQYEHDACMAADQAGRPTYGVMFIRLIPKVNRWQAEHGVNSPDLLDLNYGRRANALFPFPALRCGVGAPIIDPDAQIESGGSADLAPALGIDGDDIRHGRYPDWLKERAKTDARFDRDDELIFRAHGNTFDAAIGDIDNDGDFDLFLAEITHAWAGDSSDVSRFLVNQLEPSGTLRFTSPARLNVDRYPKPPVWESPRVDGHPRWNQGDLFCELVDFDHDGRLDLVLASGDYPDAAPFDERLRIYLQQDDGRFVDATGALGIDHLGCGQISLADVDLDGDLDLLAGQSFTRFDASLRTEAGRVNGTGETAPAPRLRLFLNQSTEHRKSIVLRLKGDPERGVNHHALGAVVRMAADLDNDPSTPPVIQSRQLIGIGGHAGKQHDFVVHFGLGDAEMAERIDIVWPDGSGTTTTLKDVEAGRHVIAMPTSEPESDSDRK